MSEIQINPNEIVQRLSERIASLEIELAVRDIHIKRLQEGKVEKEGE